jgi:putative hydrolase of the HAD superfamily
MTQHLLDAFMSDTGPAVITEVDGVGRPAIAAFPGRQLFPQGVRAAVFDVVGTLVEPSPSVAEAYAHAAARQGLVTEVPRLAERFGKAWKRQEDLDAAAVVPFVTSREREFTRWREIVEDVFADQADPVLIGRIFDDLWSHFGEPAAWRPTRVGADLVQAAIDAGLEVVLASNFDERLFDVAAAVEPLVKATRVFPSSEICWRKPAASFFRVIEERLGMAPSELVMVGDNPALDVAAARRAGWHAFLVPASDH